MEFEEMWYRKNIINRWFEYRSSFVRQLNELLEDETTNQNIPQLSVILASARNEIDRKIEKLIVNDMSDFPALIDELSIINRDAKNKRQENE